MTDIFMAQIHESGIMIATIILGVCILLVTLIQHRTYKKQNRIFCVTVMLIMFNALTSVGVLLGSPYYLRSYAVAVMVRLMHFMYFITHPLLGAAFFNYVIVCSGVAARIDDSVNSFKKKMYQLPVFFILAMGLTNPLTHFVYSVDNNGLVIRGKGEMIMYALSFAYFVMVLWTILRNWKFISGNKKWTVILFLMVTLTGILLQLMIPKIRSELFAEMMGLIGMMMLVENEDDRMDLSTGVYNRAALMADLKTSLSLLDSFNAICVRITNADTLQRLIGTTDRDLLIELVSDYLKEIHPRQYIYRTTPDSFMLIHIGTTTQAEIMGSEIYERLLEKFEYQDANILLQGVVMCADVTSVLNAGMI